MAAGAVLVTGSGVVSAAFPPISAIADDQVLIRARASLISAGTRSAWQSASKPGPEIEELYGKMSSDGFPRAKMSGLRAGLHMRRPDRIPRAAALQYALARKELEDLNPGFADQYLLSVEEFLDRALVQHRKGREEVGTLYPQDTLARVGRGLNGALRASVPYLSAYPPSH